MAPGTRWEVSWVYSNIAMFSAYAFFGAISLFWPSSIEWPWLYPFHMAGLAFNLAVIYGLIKKRPWTRVLIVVYAAGMIAHLVVFILVPISMAIAYVGPSRSFYSMVIRGLSLAGAEEYSMFIISAFNAAMVLVHSLNIWVCLSGRSAEIFSGHAVLQ